MNHATPQHEPSPPAPSPPEPSPPEPSPPEPSIGDKQPPRQRFPLALLLLPLGSILAVCLLFVLGQTKPDEDVLVNEAPLNKTSWRIEADVETTP